MAFQVMFPGHVHLYVVVVVVVVNITKPQPIEAEQEYILTRLCSAVGNVSGNRCESNCRSSGREFDPGPVPYFRGD